MTFKSYHIGILLRILLLTGFLGGMVYFVFTGEWIYSGIIAVLGGLSIYNLFRFLGRRFEVMDDFFESIKYRDFTRKYVEENKSVDIRRLYKGFNTVNEVVRQMDSERETQYLYLQKILELIDIGILAYEAESGKVLWSNGTFEDTLGFPGFKNIKFVRSRNPEVFRELFENYYPKPSAVDLKVGKEHIKVLLSNSLFQIGEQFYKLIVIHNIEETLNRTEADAWKKLLSVMTHEIMNSIAPISSLANTLKTQIQQSQQDPENYPLEIEDLDAGLQSIENRSEGLMKFARTYRSLNKVTKLNLERIGVLELFRNIEHLMKPLAIERNVQLQLAMSNKNLEIEADVYLLEQVLINLLLNALEACETTPGALIELLAESRTDGRILITVMDNGSGISEEIKDQVFVPFFTTKKEGSGIGLSLSKQIMTLHGGKIQMDGREGLGTRISLHFPVPSRQG